jgi:DNA invertase Pin-like site-specific DNA recombinase
LSARPFPSPVQAKTCSNNLGAAHARNPCKTNAGTANQQRELEAVAERHDWDVVTVFADRGESGAKAREECPAMKKLMQAIARKEVDMVAAWSVDRLGRSLHDLLGFLGELHAKGIDLYLHQQGVDTTTPAGRAMFQMIGAFA